MNRATFSKRMVWGLAFAILAAAFACTRKAPTPSPTSTLSPIPDSSIRCGGIVLSEADQKIVGAWNQLLGLTENQAARLNDFKRTHGAFLPMGEKRGPLSFERAGPCGTWYLTPVRNLDGGGTDPIAEITKAGKIVRQWSVPYEARATDAAGQTLYVPMTVQPLCAPCSDDGSCPSVQLTLAIQPSGEFEFTENRPQAKPDFGKCSAAVMKTSPYSECVEIHDAKTRKARRFVTLGACT